MTNNILVVGELNRTRLAMALASLTAVPMESVDVADVDDADNRNWDAAVSCTCERVFGDVTWALDVYLTRAVRTRPIEPHVAAYLAEQLAIVVLYPTAELLPSAYWITAPGYPRIRARLYHVEGGEGSGYVIDAVERPIPLALYLPVALQPEVIREHRMPIPVTNELTTIAALLSGTPDLVAAVQYAHTRMGAWEALTARIAAGWPPDGWYPAEFYREDLDIRDELTHAIKRLPDSVQSSFIAALQRIDRALYELTQDTDARHVAAVLRTPIADVAHSEWWWWQRLPNPEPWLPAWSNT